MIPELLAKIRACIERATNGKDVLDCDALESDLFKTINEIWPTGLTGRDMQCVNSLSGIPDAWLPDVKKAMIVGKLYVMLSAWYDDAEMDMVFTLRSGVRFEQHYGQLPDPKKLIEMAQKLRALGADFGPELNALIDSVKE